MFVIMHTLQKRRECIIMDKDIFALFLRRKLMKGMNIMEKFSKKILALILSMALLASCIIIPGMIGAIGEEETLDVWDGTYVQPSDADGDGAFEIYTPEELAWFVKYHGRKGTSGDYSAITGKLMNDIWLNDMLVTVTDGVPSATKATDTSVVIDLEDDANNGLNEWFDGVADMWFVGTLDGNGHVVNGLYVKNNQAYSSNSYGAGLIPRAGGGCTVINVGIENAYLNTNNDYTAAFLLGNVHGAVGTVKNCYVGESAYHIGVKAAAIVGGGGNGAEVRNCYNLATIVKSNSDSGYLFGDSWGKEKIYNCYTAHGYNITRPGYETKASNSYSISSAPGKDAVSTMPNLGAAFTVTAGYPELKVFSDKPEVWGGWKATGIASGTGSSEAPFIITSGEELAYAIHNTANIYVEDAAGTYKYDEESASYVALTEGEEYDGTLYSYVAPSYKLANDIYLNDITKIDWANGTVAEGYGARTWYKDINVQGTFDGDGHVVYGLYYNATPETYWAISQSIALFPRVLDGATFNITKIGVDNAYLSGGCNASAFVGSNSANNQTAETKTYLNVSECFTGPDVTLKSYLTGSAVAGLRDLHANISDSYFLDTQYGSVSTSNYGITGDAWSGSARYYRVFSPTQPLSSKSGNIAAQYNSYTYVGAPNAGTEVSDLAMKGDAPVVTMAGLGDKFVTTEGYPTLRIFLDELTEANRVLGVPEFEGAGTEDDPYLVSDAADLKAMVGLGGNEAYYKLTNDIYVNDVNAVNWLDGTVNEGYAPEQWFVSTEKGGTGYIGYVGNIQQFKGHIDGNGYAVHGLYYELGNTSTISGLLPYVGGTVTVKDLGIEDSFIGSGRFTGGLIGYTTSSAKVTVSGTYIDASCAVWGWDAGAAYVKSDSDIHTSGGSGLCLGSMTYAYNESESGAYILDGETYRAFTAADYEGTKYAAETSTQYTEDEAGTYKYDEDTETYVEIGAEEEYTGTRYSASEVTTYVESAEGTYLLDGETYREITIDDYDGTRYEQDKVWSGVNFTSEALGGLVGRFENGSTGTLDNCYVTADVAYKPMYIYGFNSQGVTFKEEGKQGASGGHLGGLWGDDWSTVKHVTATNCISLIIPHENIGNCTFSGVYTLADASLEGVTKVTVATGAEGLSEMTGLDASVWYAVKADGAYPALRLRGTVIGDVDENGVGGEATDADALRVVLIKNTEISNGDVNRNGSVDICDLVSLAK